MIGVVELWSGEELKEKFDAEDAKSMISPTAKAKKASRRPKAAAKMAKKAVKKTTKAKEGKVKKIPMLDGKKVKKALSSYIVFSNENRAIVKDELTKASEDGKVAGKDVMSELGKRWQSLDAEGKKPYEDKALVSATSRIATLLRPLYTYSSFIAHRKTRRGTQKSLNKQKWLRTMHRPSEKGPRKTKPTMGRLKRRPLLPHPRRPSPTGLQRERRSTAYPMSLATGRASLQW